jgi:hypothetical protein
MPSLQDWVKFNPMNFLKLICIVFLISAFTSDQPPVKIDDELLGPWVYSGSKDELSLFKKKNKLEKNKSGIEFKADGKFVQRQNVSWCGTPPITYGNFDGTWEKNSDSTVLITYQYHNEIRREELQVFSLHKNRMIVKYTFYQSVEKVSVERDR